MLSQRGRRLTPQWQQRKTKADQSLHKLLLARSPCTIWLCMYQWSIRQLKLPAGSPSRWQTFKPPAWAPAIWFVWPNNACGLTSDLNVRSTECKPCTAIGKILKSVILDHDFDAQKLCAEPNQEIQTVFVGPIYKEKGNEKYFFDSIDCLSKNHAPCIFDKANGSNVAKFSDMYKSTSGVSRTIRSDQANCLVLY